MSPLKIDRLELKGFGKWTQKEVHFHNGLNVIYGKNEAGKSTLQEFIKAMFFSDRIIKASDYLRKYKPWGTDFFGGNLHYTLDNGDSYRVERNFDNGHFKIYNQRFQDISGAFDIRKDRGPIFAKEHLGVDAYFFERTVLVRQMQSKLSAASRKELMESAMNLFQTGREDVSVGKVIEELNEIIKKYVGNHRTRNKPLEEISQEWHSQNTEEARVVLEREQLFNALPYPKLEALKEGIEEQKSLKEWMGLFQQKRREVFHLKEKKQVLKGQWKVLLEKESYEKAIQDKDERHRNVLLQELNVLKKNMQEKVEALDQMEYDLEEHRIFMKNVENNQEEIEILLRTQKSIKKKEQGGFFSFWKHSSEKNILNRMARSFEVWMSALSFFGFYYGFLLLKMGNPMILALGASLLLFVILHSILAILGNDEPKGELEDQAVSLEALLDKMGVKDVPDYYQKISQYDVKILKFEQLNEEIAENELRIERMETMIKHGTDLKDQPFQKAERHTGFHEEHDLGMLKQQIATLDDEIANKEMELEPMFKFFMDTMKESGRWDEAGPESMSEQAWEEIFLQNIQTLEDGIRNREVEVGRLHKEIEMAKKDLEEMDAILNRISHKKQALKKAEKRLLDIHFSVGTAITHVKEAGEHMKNQTLPYLSQSFGALTQRITAGKYKDIKVDEAFEVKAIEPTIEHIIDVSLLSGGALEQIYLALRLSLADSITKGKERLPILLDEVFAYYDDERTYESYKMLKEYAEKKQVVLFTCKKREFEIAKEVFGDDMHGMTL
jgi:DNA repair exonuclease SbcCD ATPase subunit